MEGLSPNKRSSDAVIDQMFSELREHIADEAHMRNQLADLHAAVHHKPDPALNDEGGLLYTVTRLNARIGEIESVWRAHKTFLAGFAAGVTALVTLLTDLIPRVISYFRH